MLYSPDAEIISINIPAAAILIELLYQFSNSHPIKLDKEKTINTYNGGKTMD